MTRVSDVHYDQALSEFAVQLPLESGMIQDLVCPPVDVKKESDVYYVFRREGKKLHDVDRADGAEANELEISWTTDTYTCKERALKALTTDREVDNADAPIMPEMRNTEQLWEALRMAREIRVKTIIETSGNWGGTTTPTTKWNESGADPNSDIDAAKEAFLLQFGREPNHAIINDQVCNALIRWLRNKPTGVSLADWRSLDQDFEPGGEDRRLRGLFGVPRWFVGKATYDSAAIGNNTEAMARVWGDICFLGYLDPRPSIKNRGATVTFRKRNFAVKKFREESRDATWVQVSHIDIEKVTAAAAGYLLTNMLA